MEINEVIMHGNWAEYNANPKNKSTEDCVIRAISLALNKSWDEVFTDLYNIAIKYKLMLNDKKCYSRYLKANGWVQRPCPRKSNNRKYTGNEFCNKFAQTNTTYIANIGAEHIVCIKDNKIWDSWNSSNRCIGVYWTRG